MRTQKAATAIAVVAGAVLILAGLISPRHPHSHAHTTVVSSPSGTEHTVKVIGSTPAKTISAPSSMTSTLLSQKRLWTIAGTVLVLAGGGYYYFFLRKKMHK